MFGEAEPLTGHVTFDELEQLIKVLRSQCEIEASTVADMLDALTEADFGDGLMEQGLIQRGCVAEALKGLVFRAEQALLDIENGVHVLEVKE